MWYQLVESLMALAMPQRGPNREDYDEARGLRMWCISDCSQTGFSCLKAERPAAFGTAQPDDEVS
jgi:hypothetical protein